MITIVALALFTLLCLALGAGRTWSDETLMERNELVFDGRHRNYGAYRLRTDHGQRMAVAIASAIGSFGAACVGFALLSRISGPDVRTTDAVPRIVVEFTNVVLPPPTIPKSEVRSERSVRAGSKPDPLYAGTIIVVDTTEVTRPVLDTTALASGPSGAGSPGGDAPGTSGAEGGSGPGLASAVDTVWGDFQVQQAPLFPGGDEALQDWVRKHLDFPEELNGRDKVLVQFTIGLDGAVEDVQAVKGDHRETKAAAVRTIQRMPRWKPARMNGHDVRCRLTLPIHFENR